jgi:large subunit ribosomal protein L25
MKQITLNGTLRVLGKKSDIKNLRKEGNVPCILYGAGVENIIFSVNAKELKKVTHSPNSYIINLDIEGKSFLSVLHQIQFHPVTDEAIHVDFLSVSEDKPISIDVPVKISGHSEGVKQGGKLFTGVRKLRVSGIIKDIPDLLPVDITPLTIGKQINAIDLHYDNIQIISPKTTMVCAVRVTRAVVETAPTEEGAATPEAAPAEADKK